MPATPDFPLSPDELNALCACARRGLAALSTETDPGIMANIWHILRKIGEYHVAVAEAAKKAEPAKNDNP